MKQLKYFTSHAETLRATQYALVENGIAKRNLYVFERDNIDRCYDGLILASERSRDQEDLGVNVAVLVLAMLAGAVGLYYQIMTFATFGVFCLSVTSIPAVYSCCFANRRVKPWADDKVYFLIVDVDNDQENFISNALKNRHGLISQ